MKLARRVSDLRKDHVVLQVERIDRMYLNIYLNGVVPFFVVHRRRNRQSD
jgi:hypothetical protein